MEPRNVMDNRFPSMKNIPIYSKEERACLRELLHTRLNELARYTPIEGNEEEVLQGILDKLEEQD